MTDDTIVKLRKEIKAYKLLLEKHTTEEQYATYVREIEDLTAKLCEMEDDG